MGLYNSGLSILFKHLSKLRMQLSPQSEKELNQAESTPNGIMVREQLRQLLAHSLFTNSKRYPVLSSLESSVVTADPSGRSDDTGRIRALEHPLAKCRPGGADRVCS